MQNKTISEWFDQFACPSVEDFAKRSGHDLQISRTDDVVTVVLRGLSELNLNEDNLRMNTVVAAADRVLIRAEGGEVIVTLIFHS